MVAVAAVYYPVLAIGDLVTADLLQSLVPKYYTKPSNESRSSTITLSADSDLQGIALDVGTYEIEFNGQFFTTTGGTQAIKTQWGFSGTWNSPVRCIAGPGLNNTAATTSADTYNTRGQGTSSDAVYQASATSAFTNFREYVANAIITVAGNLSIQWAQNSSSVNATQMAAGSTVRVRRIG